MLFEFSRRYPFVAFERTSLAKIADLRARLKRVQAGLDEERKKHHDERRVLGDRVQQAKGRARSWGKRAAAAKKTAASLREQRNKLRQQIGTERELHAQRQSALRKAARQAKGAARQAKGAARQRRSAQTAQWEYWSELLAHRQQHVPTLQPPVFDVVSGDVDGIHVYIPRSAEGQSTLERRVGDLGRFVHEEVELRRRFARGAGMMVDIGANVGLTCLPHAVLPDFPRILALEPEPKNFECLRYNVARNGLGSVIDCRQLAIGAEAGVAELSLTNKTGTHFIGSWEAATEGELPTEQVRVVPLDSLLTDLTPAVTPSLVKCDTQGAEGHVLTGASDLLARRTTVWQIEFWPAGLERSGSDVRSVCDLIGAAFSSFIDMDGRCVQLQPATRLQELAGTMDEKRFTDLLLLP